MFFLRSPEQGLLSSFLAWIMLICEKTPAGADLHEERKFKLQFLFSELGAGQLCLKDRIGRLREALPIHDDFQRAFEKLAACAAAGCIGVW